MNSNTDLKFPNANLLINKTTRFITDESLGRKLTTEINLNIMQYSYSLFDVFGYMASENKSLNFNRINSQKEKIFLITKKKKDNNKENNEIRIIKHNKYSYDNIIKKIKHWFLTYLRISVNNLIKKYRSNKDNDYILKKLSYKYAEQLKCNLELELLENPIKNILSKDISKQYKCSKKINEKNIQKLLKDEEKNKNSILKVILEMTFRDWIDNFINGKVIYINGKKIKFVGIKKLFKDIKKKNKNDKKYMSLFKSLLYNYENYFKNKKQRKTRIKKK